MQTAYTALYDTASAITNSAVGFNKQLSVALAIKAHAVLTGGRASDVAREWARSCLDDSVQYRAQLIAYLLAANPAVTFGQVEAGLPDEVIQAQVNSAIDTIYP